jgi:uncharacterized membrane protein
VALLALTVIATVAGILTLVPAAGASYPNVLGYRSLCTFAPAATLYCFTIAGLSCVLRASLVKRRAMHGRPVFRRGGVMAVAVVLVFAVATTGWFIAEKRPYTDGQTAPTLSSR